MAESGHKPAETPEEFLSRWSRRKRDAREEALKPPAPATPATAEEAPKLPPLEELGIDSDYRGFLHPKVDETLRRAALKKMFSDPHFNVMDGLDVYIDDYSISDPLPASMLAELKQAQKILGWAKETDEEAQKRRAMTPQQEEDARAAAEAEAAALAAQEAEALPPVAAEDPAEPLPLAQKPGDDSGTPPQTA